MKSRLMGKWGLAGLCASMTLAGQGAFGQDRSPEELLADIPRGEQIRMDALYMLDHSEKMLTGMNMLYPHQARIDQAREQILMADTAELEAVPLELTAGIRSAGLAMTQYQWSMEVAAERYKSNKIRAGSRVESRPGVLTDSGTAVNDFLNVDLQWPPSETEPGPSGFGGEGIPWLAEFDMSQLSQMLLIGSAILACDSGLLSLFGLGDECSDFTAAYDDQFSEGGNCVYPGIAYNNQIQDPGSIVPDRITTLNLKLTTEGVKDAAEQVCGTDVAGFNISAFCIATDIIWIVAEAAEQHQELCNDTIGAYELSATFRGVEAINTNTRLMYDTLVVHDEEIAVQLGVHDSELKAEVDTHDADIKSLLESTLSNQERIIELLTTPQGNRPGWND